MFIFNYEFLNLNHLISSKQFGFSPKLSTTSALTSFADKIQLYIQYCAKVMQTIIDDLSPIYKRNIAWIAERQNDKSRYQYNLCDGTAYGRYYERMEYPPTLLRSSKASMTTLPAVLLMVTSYLKFTLVSGRGV